jgi:uncharacterized protein (DUF2267 family)
MQFDLNRQFLHWQRPGPNKHCITVMSAVDGLTLTVKLWQGKNPPYGGRMNDSNGQSLEGYYEHVLNNGKLRSLEHARLWSTGVLKTLGTTLDRGTKRALAKSLPDELADSLKGVFWLLHFRDPELSSHEFRRRAARRSGNSDAEFAHFPTLAVFSGLRPYLDDDLDARIVDALSPEIREMWQEAEALI